MQLLLLGGQQPFGNSHVYPLELNGIAYDPVLDRFLVTGKLWPLIYAISFSH